MCGIVGFVNYKKEFSNKRNVINTMVQTLSNRGPDEEGIYLKNNVIIQIIEINILKYSTQSCVIKCLKEKKIFELLF